MPVQIVKKHDKVCRCRTGTDYLQVSAACLTAPVLHRHQDASAVPECRLGDIVMPLSAPRHCIALAVHTSQGYSVSLARCHQDACALVANLAAVQRSKAWL